MIGYSSHGVKTSLAVIKDLELERGNQWFDDTNLDLDKTLAIWVTKRPEDALKYVFPSGIEDMKWTEPEKQLYIQAKKNPESFVEPVDLDGFTEALDDGQGGFLFIKPVFRVTEAPIDMKVDLEIPMEQPEIGKMVKPKSMITYLGGKKKWIIVFEEDLIPLLNAKIKRNYALLDVFGGSGIVGYTFAMSDARNRLKKLYYNDLNGHTVNMLKQIKSHPDKMLELHKVIYEQFTKDPTGAGFEMLKEVSDNHKDPVIRAVAFILRQRVSYMGKGDNIPKLDSTIDQTLNKSFTAMDGMDDWHEAFRTAEIWNKEFDVAIADFESKEPSPRVIFCDPPYLGHKSSDQYAAGFDHGLHDRLVDLIRNRKSTYVLTHSITPEFQEVYGPILKDRDWHEDVYVRYGNRGDNERQHETLSVWFSR